MAEPFFSLVVATRDAAAVLPRLLGSLAAQECRDFELLIQDGASTDTTCAVAESFRKRFPALLLESQSDYGLYDAWDRALQRASGHWVLFLGADDTLAGPTALTGAREALAALPDTVELFSTPVILTLENGTPVDLIAPDRNFPQALRNGMCLPHQGLFHRREAFSNNSFNTAYKIAADYDWTCRRATATNTVLGSEPYTCMAVGGVSGNLGTLMAREREFLNISRLHFSHTPWKIYARMARCRLVSVLDRLGSPTAGQSLADLTRLLQGKPPLWTKLDADQPVPGPLPEKPSFSLIVPTIGRTEEVLRLLDSLQRQTYANFHILLGDQNPPGFLDEALAGFQNLPMTVLRLESRGVSAARNALLDMAEGDIIVFPDDDCWYQPDTLASAARFFGQYPGTGGVLGQWLGPGRNPHRPGPDEIPGPLTRYSAFRRGETYVQFYRREAVDAVQGFDDRLGPGTGLPYGCGEDTDYLLQVLQAGFPVWRDPRIHVFHPPPDMTDPNLPSKALAYGQGRMFVLRKHGLPWWFKLLNVLYPIYRLAREPLNAKRYRWAMFVGRLRGLLRMEKDIR